MRKRLKRFLQRHNQWLTLIAALIVFLTFVVNDVKRERLRELKSSIAAAQSFVTVREDIHFIEILLLQSHEQIRTPTDEILHALRMSQMPSGYLAGFDVRFDLDRISQLARILPDDVQTTNELQSLKSKSKELEAAYNEVLHLFAEGAEFDRLPDPRDVVISNAKKRRELQTKWEDYSRHNSQFEAGVKDLLRRMLACAEQVRDRSERRYKLYTNWSYFLYGFGWAIALMGRLFGIEGMPGSG
jgi:hypothetical protein